MAIVMAMNIQENMDAGRIVVATPRTSLLAIMANASMIFGTFVTVSITAAMGRMKSIVAVRMMNLPAMMEVAFMTRGNVMAGMTVGIGRMKTLAPVRNAVTAILPATMVAVSMILGNVMATMTVGIGRMKTLVPARNAVTAILPAVMALAFMILGNVMDG